MYSLFEQEKINQSEREFQLLSCLNARRIVSGNRQQKKEEITGRLVYINFQYRFCELETEKGKRVQLMLDDITMERRGGSDE
ncbi:hypothetical protein [Listeria ilorinensis]|uniref:hypothetical protein n=1 Tax=Listeria ilorinensis TaxID=2867439 RepID=UPI001EF5A7C6|nr:hypothetical protein [Listeria ilorinensis]